MRDSTKTERYLAVLMQSMRFCEIFWGRYLFACIALMLVITGCARHTVEVGSVSAANESGTTLQRDAKLYVSLSHDGRYGATNYHGSGYSVSRMLRDALQTYSSAIIVATKVEQQCAALQSAQAAGARYLFMPNILHWEDRNTPWSGLLDHVKIEISVYDVQTGEVLNRTVVAANNQWATFRNNPPDVLLPQPLSEFVCVLFK